MIDKKWLEELKAGDEVIVCSWGWSYKQYKTEIEKVTSKGFIKVDGCLYKSTDGSLYKGKGSVILNPNNEKVKENLKKHKEKCFINQVIKEMQNISEITFEQAVQIKSILNEKVKNDTI